MTKGMDCGEFGNIRLADCFFYYILYGSITNVMASHPSAMWINGKIISRD